MRGGEGVRKAHEELVRALSDSSPYVRIVAAEALGQYGDGIDLERSLGVLADLGDARKQGYFVNMAALNSLGALELHKTAPLQKTIRQFTPECVNAPRPLLQLVCLDSSKSFNSRTSNFPGKPWAESLWPVFVFSSPGTAAPQGEIRDSALKVL